LRKLLSLAFSLISRYSSQPLRFASVTGLLTSVLGFFTFVYVVVRRLVQTDYVPGFAFTAAEIALFAGLQLFAIGTIGEYLARIHFRTLGKPAYVVRRETLPGPEPE
jgi:undecaprenyl-phosphate 4-deoxy-4-formamido-L-arabinose transferase